MGHLGWMARFSLTNVGISFIEDHRNFAALIHISSSSGTNSADVSYVFDYLSSYAERKKIAVTLDDGTTQCYVEIVKWDVVSREAFLWVNIPIIYSGDSSNLMLYLYFDPDQPDNDTYVCDLGEVPVVQSVFFQAGIFHLSDSDPSSVVSSSGYYPWDMTTYNLDSGNSVSGKIGNFLDLNGSDEYCEEIFSYGIQRTCPFSLECIVKTSQTTGNCHAVTIGGSSGLFAGIGIRNGKASIFIDNGGGLVSEDSSATFADGQYHHLLGRFNADNDRELYVDGNLVASSSDYVIPNVYFDTMSIGRTAQLDQDYFEGEIGEVRFHLGTGFAIVGAAYAGIIKLFEDSYGNFYVAIADAIACQKSIDIGRTWNNTGSLSPTPAIGYSIIELASGRIVLATGLTTGEVFYSDNGGTSWTQSGNLLSGTRIKDLFLDSSGNLWACGRVITSNQCKIWKSVNNGVTWDNGYTLANTFDVYKLFEDTEGNLFCTAAASAGYYGTVYKSDDGGSTWSATSGWGSSDYACYDIIEIDDILYVIANRSGYGTCFKSTDWGDNWTYVGSCAETAFKLWYDSNSGILFGFGGYKRTVWKSYDLGITWVKGIDLSLTSENIGCILYSSASKLYIGADISYVTDSDIGEETWLYSEEIRTAEYTEASYLNQFDQLFYFGDLDSSHKINNINFSVLGRYDTSAFFTTLGKTFSDVNFFTKCTVPKWDKIRFIVKCVSELYSETGLVSLGKTLNDIDLLAFGKFYGDINFIVQAIKSYGIRMGLTDPLNLRDTSVFATPKEFNYLGLVHGNFINSRIPCTPLDQDGYIQHISDGVIHSINEVQRDGEPISYGFTTHTNYQDSTGKAIACVIFDTAQNDVQISVSCKGRVKETGELIENPADFLRDIFLNVQKYDPDVIDETNLSQFYSDCLNNNIRIASYLNEVVELREIFDDLSINICAASIISDSKQRIRLKWTD